MADYDAAESIWHDVLALAQEAEDDEVRRHVPFVAKTLVDCFAEANELPRAQRIAQEAWERCRDLAPILATSQIDLIGDGEWVVMFHRAKLDWRAMAETWLGRHKCGSDACTQGIVLSIRNWLDDPEAVLPDWTDWVHARVAAGEFKMLDRIRHVIGSPLLARGEWRADSGLFVLHGRSRSGRRKRSRKYRVYWGWGLSRAYGAIKAGDLDGAQEMALRRIEECGLVEGGWEMVTVAAARGVATPPEVVAAIEKAGMDENGLTGWCMVAREAAAVGDEIKAFEALRRALSYWTNPPLGFTIKLWGNDAYWGESAGTT